MSSSLESSQYYDAPDCTLLHRLCVLLEGKGGGKGRFNAKINNLKNVTKIEQYVAEYFSDK